MSKYDVRNMYYDVPGLSDVGDERDALWGGWKAGGGGIQKLLRDLNKPLNSVVTPYLAQAGMSADARRLTQGYDPLMPQNVTENQLQQGQEGDRRQGIFAGQQAAQQMKQFALAQKQENRRFKMAGQQSSLEAQQKLMAGMTSVTERQSFWDKLKGGLALGAQIGSFFLPGGQLAGLAGGLGGLFGGGGGHSTGGNAAGGGGFGYGGPFNSGGT
jgi:hypothetical protein